MPDHHFYPLRVARIEKNALAWVLTFDVPELLKQRFAYRAGQYLTLRARIDKQFVDRAYAICSAPHEDKLQIAIKDLPGGRMSAWVRAQATPGRWLMLSPPAGSFCVDLAPLQRRHYVGFCGGSGVTALYCQLKDILHVEPLSRYTLVLADIDEASVIFLPQLRQLQRRLPSRFSYLLVLRDAAPGTASYTGLLDQPTIAQLFRREIDADQVDLALIVGAPAMMDDTAAMLAGQGVPEHKILTASAALDSPARRASTQHPIHPLAGGAIY
ncbi:FAD-binding oxidoreductase [Massilia sp. CCM 8734]|uniref:FAD-binding oxidoreductase n=1 Tax=Massilia sp. CCM 8734 TaxID=2609283 RepID=UPI00141EDF6D